MVVKTKYDKTNVKTSDFIAQYCDHRDTCKYQGKQCNLQQMPDIVANGQDDNVAYIHEFNCPNYRTNEDGIIGADVTEIGVWK